MNMSVKSLWRDERGFLVSAELILIATILVIGLVAGMSCLQSAIIQEFNDLSWAISSLNQSYRTNSYFGCKGAFSGGSSYFGNMNQRGWAGPGYNYGYGMGYGSGYGYSSGYGVGYGGYVQGPPAPARVLRNDYGAEIMGPCLDAKGKPLTGAAAGNCAPNASGSSHAPNAAQGSAIDLPCNGCNPGDAPAVVAPQPEAQPLPNNQVLPSPPKPEGK